MTATIVPYGHAELQEVLQSMAASDVLAALWNKLIINCAFNALSAIAQRPYGVLVRQAGVPELMREAYFGTVFCGIETPDPEASSASAAPPRTQDQPIRGSAALPRTQVQPIRESAASAAPSCAPMSKRSRGARLAISARKIGYPALWNACDALE